MRKEEKAMDTSASCSSALFFIIIMVMMLNKISFQSIARGPRDETFGASEY